MLLNSDIVCDSVENIGNPYLRYYVGTFYRYRVFIVMCCIVNENAIFEPAARGQCLPFAVTD